MGAARSATQNATAHVNGVGIGLKANGSLQQTDCMSTCGKVMGK